MKKKITISPSVLVSAMQGHETLQNSVFRCTRCNACVQSCPSYKLHAQESFSPRGRVQILRLLLEGKIKYEKNTPLINQTVADCILCGRCTAACAGKIPIAEHMVYLRKTLRIPSLSWPLRKLLRCHTTHFYLFDKIVRFIQFLRYYHCWLKIGGVTPALKEIDHLHQVLPSSRKTLQQILRKKHFSFQEETPSCIYFPSLEACYIEPEIGLRSLRYLQKKKIHVLFGFSSGLFEYLYGENSICLQTAKRLLLRWEKLTKNKKIPLVTDSIEVYGFLKMYPLLFASQNNWHQRAQRFAQQVRFITDYIPSTGKSNTKTLLESSSLLVYSQQMHEQSQKILKTLFGKNLLECEYRHFPVPLGTASFTHTQAFLAENVRAIAQRQIEKIFCLSALAAFELSASFKKHYPNAKAQHIVFASPVHDRI